ncbi:uncharacterized protein LOC109365183 isoform X1 [Meleagris gallopavo]|uniref:uncharacterized protein LOC109365183 isoform X1 n=1 Tax=Meleagris gallopavo TaxID=9103 RepID=UPI0012AB50FC|nr:uncharacterized protein LOC109365183 isoform X1 [Meleagris gallopavo]
MGSVWEPQPGGCTEGVGIPPWSSPHSPRSAWSWFPGCRWDYISTSPRICPGWGCAKPWGHTWAPHPNQWSSGPGWKAAHSTGSQQLVLGTRQGTHSDNSMLQSPGQQELHIITFHAYIAALGAAKTQSGGFGAGAELIQWDGASCKRCLKTKKLLLEWRNNTEVVVGGDPGGLLSKPCTELHCKGAETFRRPPRAAPKGFCSTEKKETRTAWSRGAARVYIWEHTTITWFLCSPPTPQPQTFSHPLPTPNSSRSFPAFSCIIFLQFQPRFLQFCWRSECTQVDPDGPRSAASIPARREDGADRCGWDAALQLSETRSKSLPP